MPSNTTLSCCCGRLMTSSDFCYACGQPQRGIPHRTNRARVSSADPSARSSTLSPSPHSFQSHRHSLDMHPPSRGREISPSTVFTRAFSLGPEHDNDSSSPSNVDLFPPSVYRTSSRTSSRTNSSRSASVYSLTPSTSAGYRPSAETMVRPSEVYSATPATGTGASQSHTSADQVYAPMAAGFSRLRRQDGTPLSSQTTTTNTLEDARRVSADAGLGARMFVGPA